jgi:hypothetical protein
MNEKQQKQGRGNSKFKLRTKVRRGNVTKDAGSMIRDTDAKNRDHQLKWYMMYKEFEELKHRYRDKQREVTTEKPKTKHNNNTKTRK